MDLEPRVGREQHFVLVSDGGGVGDAPRPAVLRERDGEDGARPRLAQEHGIAEHIDAAGAARRLMPGYNPTGGILAPQIESHASMKGFGLALGATAKSMHEEEYNFTCDRSEFRRALFIMAYSESVLFAESVSCV